MNQDGKGGGGGENEKQNKKKKESASATISSKAKNFMASMRMPTTANKTRAPIPVDFNISGTAASASSNNPNQQSSHDNTFTFYGSSELSTVPSAGNMTNDFDVNALSDDELRERFKSVMDDLVEGNETKKKMFEQMSVAHMREMLNSHYKLATNEMTGQNSPEYQVQCLNNINIDNLYSKNSKETFERIAFSLKKYGLKWSKVFGEDDRGPYAMLKALNVCIEKVRLTREKVDRDGGERREKQNTLYEILGAGIEAFRAYLNLGWNFNSMKEALASDISERAIHILNILFGENDERLIKTKNTCAILLFTLAMPNENNPSNGQNIVRLLASSAQKWCPSRERFECLIQGLDGTIEHASNFLMCINAIFVTLSTEHRYHLRSELFRSGFKHRFEELQKKVGECEDPKQRDNLSTQVNLFLRHVDDDYQAMNIKLESISNTWADLHACFDYLYGLVKGTSSEEVLSSIINRLICIRDDQNIRHSYLRLIDECITRIVFSRSACDPDFDTYSMDSESIGDSALSVGDHPASVRGGGSLYDIAHMAAVASANLTTTENEVQMGLMKGRVEHLEKTREKLTNALETILKRVDEETAASIRKQYVDIFGESPSKTAARSTSRPPPPPPPLPTSMGSMPPPPPPPPAPPAPVFGAASNMPPPPPPGPPPLPDYLPTKQKYVVGETVKKVAWTKLNPQSIKKDSVWTNIDEKRCQDKAFFTTIKENFATKSAPVKSSAADLSDSESTTTTTKKTKEFRVIDPRAGQNFAIMFSQLKATPQQFRQWLLACDSTHLTGDLLAQLDKSLPSADELKKLAEFKNEINDLPDSEQYFCAVSDIKRLPQRIKTLLFKSHYKEMLEETEKQLVAGRQACETVRRSPRFPKMLELVLTVGNYMNSSAKAYEPIYGFDISFLPKLHSTKANDGKRTLLHFMIQEIEKDHSDLLKFGDEFQGLAEVASKIDTNELQRTLMQIKSRVNAAQADLDSAKATPNPDHGDRFIEALEGFVQAARDDVERLEGLSTKMTNAYQDLCDFLTIDAKKYLLNEFFTDLKAFCNVFLTCLQENRLWREQDEKAKRSQASKQLVDDIRKKHRAEPKPERNTFFKPSDEDTDVVSNLMSVLKDANVSGQTKRIRRPPGRIKCNDIRTKITDRENNAQITFDTSVTPRLLTSSILKDRNYL